MQVIVVAWEDFLDMTISQAVLWAAQNIAPDHATGATLDDGKVDALKKAIRQPFWHL